MLTHVTNAVQKHRLAANVRTEWPIATVYARLGIATNSACRKLNQPSRCRRTQSGYVRSMMFSDSDNFKLYTVNGKELGLNVYCTSLRRHSLTCLRRRG